MNANYQHLSITAAAILLAVFVVVFVVFRTQAPATDFAPEQIAEFSPQTSPDDSSFAPFQAPDSPQAFASQKTVAKSSVNQARQPQLQHADPFAQFPRNSARPLKDSEAELHNSAPIHESLEQRQEQRWMAKISPEQEAKIDAVIDAAEQRHIETMAKNVNRRTAIQTVDRVTQICFEELYNRAADAAGRIIVNFEIQGGPNNRGIFENVHIANNYNLHDMAFEACIVAAIHSATFEALESGSLWVEHALQTDQLPPR